jgi:PAS domain-containing protein
LSPLTVRTYWKQIREKYAGANRSRIIAEVVARNLTEELPDAPEPRVLLSRPVQMEIRELFAPYVNQLAAALTALNVPVVIAWGSEGTIVFGSRAFEELLRRPVIYSDSIRDYGSWLGFWESGRQLAVHEWPVARVLGGEAYVEEDIYFLRDDGRWVLTRVQAVPILENGETAGAMAVALKVREFGEPPWAHRDDL